MANDDTNSPLPMTADGRAQKPQAQGANAKGQKDTPEMALQRASNDEIKNDKIYSLPTLIEKNYKAICGEGASWPPKVSKNPEEWEMQAIIPDALREAANRALDKYGTENVPAGFYDIASAMCAAKAVNAYFAKKDAESPPTQEMSDARKPLTEKFQKNVLGLLKKGADAQVEEQKQLRGKNPILSAHREIDGAYEKWNKKQKVKDHLRDVLPEPFSLIGSFLYELLKAGVKGMAGIGAGILKAVGETHAILQGAAHKKEMDAAFQEIAENYTGRESTDFLKKILDKGAATVAAAEEEKSQQKHAPQRSGQSPAGQGVAGAAVYPQMMQAQQQAQRNAATAAQPYPQMRQPETNQPQTVQHVPKPPKPKKGATANDRKRDGGATRPAHPTMSGANPPPFNPKGALTRMGVTAVEKATPGASVRPTGERGSSGRSSER
ncbi:MAG: hypothetical protein ABW189_00830 [Rickettsiales bacterium]